MTYSNTYSSPSSPTNFNPFSGMGMRKGGRPSLFPGSGDGSTLNLDFTTGVLDSRLTFSRASTATFVNSSGYVESAASNEMTYSQSQDSNTFWSAFGTNVVRTSAQTDPNGGTAAVKLVFTATAADAVISRTVAINNGLPYTISMWMRSDSGTLTNVRFARGAAATGAFFPTLTTTWQRVSLSFTSTGANDGIEIRVLNSGSPQTATFHVYGAQLESGSTVRAYQPAVAAAAYYAPRFDYSPTNIGEPRGLLIEGSAINSALYSENINPNSSPQNIYWVVTGGSGASLASVIPVSQTDPANGTTASRCILGTSAVGRVYQGVSTTIGATYTMSFWAKSISGNTALHFWHYNSATGNYTAVTVGTSWARYQITVLARSGGGFVEFGIANLTATAATVDLWGMQVELGSGASSYIVTGASQVTRNADFLFSASSSGAGRSNEFSLDDLAPGISALNEHTVLWTYGRDPNSKREYPASLYARTNANTERIDLRDFSGTTVEVGTQTRTVQSVTVGTASIVKIALAQSTSAYPSSAINGTSATLTSGVIDSALGLQWVQLCNSSAVGISFNPIWARQLKVYPTALTAAQLQTLTTL